MPLRAVAAAPAPLRGSDAAASVTSPPATVYKPKAPKVDRSPPAQEPPPGSAQRTFLDKMAAAQAETARQIKARTTPTTVTPAQVPGQSTRLADQPPAHPARTTTVQASAARTAAVVTAAATDTTVDPCALVPGEALYAAYSGGSLVLTPTNTSAGAAQITVTNKGTQSWPAGHTWLGYHLYDSAGHAVAGSFPMTALPTTLATGDAVTLTAPIAALAPGTWKVLWDVSEDGIGWFSQNGVCAMTVSYTIQNQPPNLTLQTPPNYGTVTTRTPTLSVTGQDVDKWPNANVTFQIIACKDAALTKSCVTTDWGGGTYQIPPDILQWNDTFYWSARVTDGGLMTPSTGWAPPNQVTVVVPAPDTWRAVGAGLGLATVDGVVLPYGMWVDPVTDAAVQGPGVPLQIQRYYSSAAAQQGFTGAFGHGWLSALDAGAQYSPDGQLLTVTYPDGRQEIFGKLNGGWVSRATSGSTDRVTVDANSVITVKESSQEVVTYGPAGELRTVAQAGSGELDFARNAAGQVSTVTQQPSGRSLTVAWTTDQGSGCTAPQPPMVGEVDTDGAGSGDQPMRWLYSYHCGKLTQLCDPANECTQYNTGDTSAWFSRSAAGRTVAEPLEAETGWTSNSELTDLGNGTFRTWYDDAKVFHLTEPDGNSSMLLMYRPQAAYLTDYQSAYNSQGGPIVEADLGGIGNTAVQYRTYRFDELNRLIVLNHGMLKDTASPHRNWMFSAVNGQFLGMSDENYNNFQVTYDGSGNMTGQFRMRDASTQVTHQANYAAVPGGDPADMRIAGVQTAPEQVSQQDFAMFGYDSQGRLVQRTGNPVPEATGGPVTSYTYTAGTETAVGARRGGTGPATVPAGLLRSSGGYGAITTYDYNPDGDLTQVTEPSGRRVVYDYDDLGRRTSQTEYTTGYPSGVQTRYTLDPVGRVVEQVDPATTNAVTHAAEQLRTCRVYDGDGLVTRTVQTGAAACPSPAAARTTGNRTTDTAYDNAGRPTKVTDPGGAVSTYAYGITYRGNGTDPQAYQSVTDSLGRTEQHWYRSGQVSEIQRSGPTGQLITTALYSYDPAGRLTQESDALGRVTTYQYTWDDQLTSEVRPGVVQADGTSHDVTLFNRTYDGSGRVTSQTDAGLRVTTSSYDAEGKLVDTVLDPNGLNRKVHRTYTGLGELATSTATGGGVTEQTTYCATLTGLPTCESVVLANGNLTTSYQRDQRGLVTGTIGADGNRIDYDDATQVTQNTAYDELGRQISTTTPLVSAEQNGQPSSQVRETTTYGYDVFGDQTQQQDAAGNTTTTVYDDAGRVVEVDGPAYTPPGASSPIVPVTRKTYDSVGQLFETTDPRGGVTTNSYDLSGRLTQVQGPAVGGVRPTTQYGYDAAGQVSFTVDPTGARTEFGYDALGRKVASTVVVRQPNGALPIRYTTAYGYDDLGDLTSVRSPGGGQTRTDYDVAGEPVAAWTPGVTNPTRYQYDLAGQVTRVTDPAGRITENQYDLAERLVLVRHRAADGTQVDVSTTNYDAPQTVLATNPNGTTTETYLDMLGRPVSQRRSGTGVPQVDTTVGYDLDGHPSRQTDGNGNATVLSYNSLGLPETMTEPATTATPALTDRQWTFGYNAAGDLTRMVKPGGVTADLTVDTRGETTQVHGYGGGAADATTTVGYDLDGRRVSAANALGTQTFDYDDRSLLLDTHGVGDESAYAYTANGQAYSRTDTSGTSSFGWRQDGQLASLTDPLTGVTQTYGYDPNTGERQSLSLPNGTGEAWQYDGRGRTSALSVHNAAGTTVYSAGYSYDGDSNLTNTNVTVGAPGGSYAYDGLDRLTRWVPQGGGPEHDYTWDADGNRLTEQTVTGTNPAVQIGSWTYDQRDRLTTAQTAAGAQTLQYTPRGTLASTATSGGATTQSTFDAFDRLTGDGGTSYSYDPLNRPVSRSGTGLSYAGTGQQPVGYGTESYARGPAGTPAAARTGGTGSTALLPVADPHGDLVGWEAAGAAQQPAAGLSASTSYDPFGTVVAHTGAAPALGFQGDWTDPATGWVDMGARWYTPAAADFASRDDRPVPNRYGYADGNPVSNTDPDGHKSHPMVCDLGEGWGWGYQGCVTSYTGPDGEGFTPESLAYDWSVFVSYRYGGVAPEEDEGGKEMMHFVLDQLTKRLRNELLKIALDPLMQVDEAVESNLERATTFVDIEEALFGEGLSAGAVESVLAAIGPEAGAAVVASLSVILLAKMTENPFGDVMYDAKSRDYYRLLPFGRVEWCGCPVPQGQSPTIAPPAQPARATPPSGGNPNTPPPPAPPSIVSQTTQELVKRWSTWSTYHTQTRRYVRDDNYTQVMADTHTTWSNGAWRDTGWHQQSLNDSWRYWWALTLDPSRVSAGYEGGVLPWVGHTYNEWAAPAGTGSCGLNGTLVSCLAQSVVSPVGGGCADVQATVAACEPVEPVPGNPNGLREADQAGSADRPTG
ncbi:RHS repeat-associated core domain-containing protein [Kitasatospora sp. NPDC058965]|uniref:RHS repeat-associated core domain-containing protein n=1 Tax=Kitasatospora sp. NPDC058965 TaxID=3346682 RepID=UPI0036B9099F